jgi:putative ABC transport system permease protein
MNSIGLETLWQDLRYGARLLRLKPGFTIVAIASLALGIGANTAIFQLLDAVRLRTLPVHSPQELAEVRITDMTGARGSFSSPYPTVTNQVWERIRTDQKVFSGMLAWSTDGFNLAQNGEARNAQGLWVSGDFFRVLGVSPVLGRVFTAADDQRGCGSPGVVLSYRFWQREFAGDASAIGKKLTLDGHPLEVIGVTPASFFGLEIGRSFDLAVPICSEAIFDKFSRLDHESFWWLTVMGRLRPGWKLERAAAQLATISPGIFEATLPPNYPPLNVKNYLGFKLTALPAGTGVSMLREMYSDPLWLLLAIAGLVLLIACANLANLMLARASAREREIAVRLALGASPTRLVRQLLAESLLLAGAGAVLGAILAQDLSRFLVSFLSTRSDSLFIDLALDWRVLGFTAGVAVLTCAVFGLTPALRATQTAPGAMLKTAGRSLTASRERFGLRRILVAAQVALSLVLLVGALLFSGSLRKLVTVETGFRPEGILTLNIDLEGLKLPIERWHPYKRELLDRLRSILGVDAAAEVKVVPLSGSAWDNKVWADGRNSGQATTSCFNLISSGYFQTLGIPLLGGRDFNQHDTSTSPEVAIVNAAFARRLGLGPNAVGKRFRKEATPFVPEKSFEIVGVVKDTKYRDLREDFMPIAYLVTSQDPTPNESDQFLIRSSASAETLVSAVKHAIQQASPLISFDVRIFQTQIEDSLLRERLMATLSSFFGGLAVALASIGLYGIVSYTVVRRTNEIGIRMALGADRSDVVAMILREAAKLVTIGLAAGTLLALGAGLTARALLFGLTPYDPATLAVAVGVLAAVAAVASYLPARRAAGLDPMTALRDE